MAENISFQQIRKEYHNEGLAESDLTDDPFELFRGWYHAAQEYQPAQWLEPNAMSLATSDGAGRVSNRYVLMKGIEPDGICFFTNYDSQKGRELNANPRAAAAFHWAYMGRQVRIEGTVEKTSREVSQAYFHSRPRGSQVGAAASAQSTVVPSREALELAKQQIESEFADREIPLPDHWGGYRIRADRIEFWQGRLDRMHDRIVYRREADRWRWERISP